MLFFHILFVNMGSAYWVWLYGRVLKRKIYDKENRIKGKLLKLLLYQAAVIISNLERKDKLLINLGLKFTVP